MLHEHEALLYGEGYLLNENANPFEGVSIVVPAHNEAKYLGNTLKSIRLAVETLRLVAEVIVVDDDSTDETSRIAEDAGAKVVSVSLRNIGAVRNAGAAAATFPWLVFVDADTEVPVSTLLASLQNLADGDSGGGARVDLPDRDDLFFLKRWMFYAVTLVWHIAGGWAAGCYMYCRKDLFDSFGGFDEQYFAAEELFFSRQLMARGRFRLVKTPVMTSSRKLHAYSLWELCRFVTLPMLTWGGVFKSKRGLELLYEDQR